MTSRDQVQVQQLKLSPQEMKTAMARASENSKSRVVWQDTKKMTPVTSQKR